MNFESIRFPIQGSVQKFVHFLDESHQYVFSFASPFIYDEPQQLKQKKAFLIGKYNPFDPNLQAPESIYATFTLAEKRTDYPQPKMNLKQQRIQFENQTEDALGAMDVLFPRNRLLKFSSQVPNIIYNPLGEPVAFCLFQPKLHRKSIFSFKPSFTRQHAELTDETVRELENDGTIRCHYAYELVRRDNDFRKRMEAWFSPEKKAGMIANRISMIQRPDSDEQSLFLLTALIAFFWTTIIDYPLTEN